MVNKQYSATDLEAFMKIAVNWQNNNHNLLEGVDIKGEMQQYMNSPAMNMYKKRERTQNWNHQEKKFLLDLCRKDMRIIENKRLDAGLTAVKNKAWKIIHQKFSSQFGTDRTCNRLKEQWRRMKACTRNEILDYNNRLARFGTDVADRKKPSPFTFEVWDFMQEAKKACKSEALDGIDYSKIPLALEEDYEYREDEQNGDDDHDMDDSRTPPQELCDVDIKEETSETYNDSNIHNDSLALGERRLSASSPSLSRLGTHDLERANSLHSPAGNLATSSDHANSTFLTQNGANGGAPPPGTTGDMGAFQPTFNMSNISATLEALNALRTGQFPSAAAAAAAALQNNFAAAAAQHQQQHNPLQQQQQQQQLSTSDDQPLVKRPRSSSGNGDEVLHDLSINGSAVAPSNSHTAAVHVNSNGNGMNALSIAATTTPEMRVFMEMQSKEHLMRMKILEVQLQAAKYNRDLVEINKTLALQKLQEMASKRLTS